ncbi:MAG TPA: hypothetical protein VJ398_03330 [Acidimicrobiia bacterium]|nr:hypothetical protein [Acidimicrobiia bacterium]
MRWRTTLTAGALIALATVPIVAQAGADAVSARRPKVTATAEWDRGECPLLDETATAYEERGQWMASPAHQDWMASTLERHGQMHGVDDPMPGSIMGDRGHGMMIGPGVGNDLMMGRGSVMGNGMGG